MTAEARREPESVEMPKEVLEVGGKRCKFGAIENEQQSKLLIRSVSRSSVAVCRTEHKFRVCTCYEAPASDSAEQLIRDPCPMESKQHDHG